MVERHVGILASGAFHVGHIHLVADAEDVDEDVGAVQGAQLFLEVVAVLAVAVRDHAEVDRVASGSLAEQAAEEARLAGVGHSLDDRRVAGAVAVGAEAVALDVGAGVRDRGGGEALEALVERAHGQAAIVVELQGGGQEDVHRLGDPAAVELFAHRRRLVDGEAGLHAEAGGEAGLLEVELEFLGEVEHVFLEVQDVVHGQMALCC